MFLATMTPPCVGDYPAPRNVSDPDECEALTTRELEMDLADLNVDAVDLVMLHGPSNPDFDFAGSCSEQICEVNAAQWRAYSKFLAAGKTRAIGVSNYCVSCLECLLKSDDVGARARNLARRVAATPRPNAA